MLQGKFSLQTEKINDSTSVIEMNGEVTSFLESALMDAYNKVNTPDLKVLILNFSRLEYMNSSGIGLLITLLIRTNRQGQKMYTSGLSEHYRRIFELTRLNEAIQIYPDMNRALESAS